MAAEATLEKAICAYARKLGILAYKFSSPAHRGVPDRIFVAPGGRVLFMEIKAKGKKPTPLQAREIRLLKEQGANAWWVSDLEEALSLLDTMLR